MAKIMNFGDGDSQSYPAPVVTASSASSPIHAVEVDLKSPGIAATAEDSIRTNLSLRYRLLPYIYAEAHHHYETGFPMVRPMVLAFPQDHRFDFNRYPLEYMFGDAFLVAPVTADLRSMEIYLPAGEDWIDYYSKTEFRGGQKVTYSTSNPNVIPLFVRRGSIIPMRQPGEWIDPSDHDGVLTLDIYPAEQRSDYSLYEDDGVSLAYQSGGFTSTPIYAQRKGNRVTVQIGPSAGTFSGAPGLRQYFVDINLVDKSPAAVLVNGKKIEKTDFPKSSAGDDVWIYNASRKKVRVNVRMMTKQGVSIEIE